MGVEAGYNRLDFGPRRANPLLARVVANVHSANIDARANASSPFSLPDATRRRTRPDPAVPYWKLPPCSISSTSKSASYNSCLR
jgi:hypothetical protein